MGTRSLTRIHEAGRNSPVILSFYRQFDGYIEGGHGDELVAFLKPFTIVNGFSYNQVRPIANGMNCLAALLICHFKDGQAGGIYIAKETDEQAYNYDVYLNDDNKIGVNVKEYNEKERVLLGVTKAEVSYTKVAEFVYPDAHGENKWRRVGIIDQDNNYITGFDLNDSEKFKKFRVERILENKVFVTDVDANL